MRKKYKEKDLIWHIVGEMVNNRVGQGFIFHVITPANHIHFLVQILLVKLKNLHTVWEEWGIPVCLGDNDKNLGRVLLGGMSKNQQILFFDSQMY